MLTTELPRYTGTCISESMAICRYFEETQSDPPLTGTTPPERATIEMWQRRVELGFLFSVGMSFQRCTGFFKDRMTPNQSWGEDCTKSAYGFLKLAERQLAANEYMAGETFSIVDITMLCALDFGRIIDIRLSEKHPNVKRWYDAVSARPSAKS